MLKYARLWRCFVVAVFFASAPAAAIASEAPSRIAIAGHLAEIAPDNLRLLGFDFRNFPGPAAGTGRTSIAGTFGLTQNIYRDSRFNAIKSELQTAGLSPAEAIYYLNKIIGGRRTRTAMEYALVSKKGRTVHFSAELEYLKTDDGVDFVGDLSIPAVDRVSGIPEDSLREEDYVVGSEKFIDLFNKVVSTKETAEARVKPAASAAGQPPASADAVAQTPEQLEAALALGPGQRREIQRRLMLLGFNTRGVDGVFGEGTRAAISAWQNRHAAQSATGYIAEPDLKRLKAESAQPYAQWRQRRAKAKARAAEEAAAKAKQEAAKSDGKKPAGKADGCARDENGKIIQKRNVGCDLKALGETITK